MTINASARREPSVENDPPKAVRRGPAGALLVGAGIFASRVFGLVRERVFAHAFGNSVEAAAFKAALRIPNFLQNLFGEGVLSASFIPVYAGLLAKGDEEAADRLAGAVFGLLSAAMALLVALGVVFTPAFIGVVAPGFHGPSRELTIDLVRILFPGTGLLVLSAWCLGILNSHRRFFLSYAAPVLWNVAIIGAILVGRGGSDLAKLSRLTAWGAGVGSLLQLAVQLPTVWRLVGAFRPSLDVRLSSVREVLRGFGSVVVGRGVVQVSAYVDTAFASLISERALSALAYAQTIYLLPVSLFGMAVSASELAEMSRTTGSDEEVANHVRGRMEGALRRMAFFIVPSAAALLVVGDVVAAALLQTGRFGAGDTRYLWYLLAGSALGLFASTQGRLYASAFYALKQPRTPLRFAVTRVLVNALLAWACVVVLPRWLGWPRDLAAAGVTATSGLAAWIEFALLRSALSRRVGETGLSRTRHLQLWGAGLLAAGAGLAVKVALVHRFGADRSNEWAGAWLPMPHLPPLWTAVAVLPVVAGVYGLACLVMRVEEATAVVARVSRRLRR